MTLPDTQSSTMVSHFSETVSSANPDCRNEFWESDGHDWFMHEKLIRNTLNSIHSSQWHSVVITVLTRENLLDHEDGIYTLSLLFQARKSPVNTRLGH